MRWEFKSLTVTTSGLGLMALARLISFLWADNPLTDYLIPLGFGLIVMGTLHLCLNAIAESFRK